MSDKLKDIYDAQIELIKRLQLSEVINDGDRTEPVFGKFIIDTIACIHNELEELRDSVYWKHWTSEAKTEGMFNSIRNLQNARVEAIDILFFLLEIMIALGLKPDDIYNLYMKKWIVNMNRQDTGYSMDNKTEDDNKDVT